MLASQFDPVNMLVADDIGNVFIVNLNAIGYNRPTATTKNGVQKEEVSFQGLRAAIHNGGLFPEVKTLWRTFTSPVLNITCDGLKVLVMTESTVYFIDTVTERTRMLCYTRSVGGHMFSFISNEIEENVRMVTDVLSFSDDGCYVAIGRSKTVFIFNVEQGSVDDTLGPVYETAEYLFVESQSFMYKLDTGADAVLSAEFSRDNKTILLSGLSMVVQLWDVEEGSFLMGIGGAARHHKNKAEVINTRRMLQQEYAEFTSATFWKEQQQEGVEEVAEGGKIIMSISERDTGVGSVSMVNTESGEYETFLNVELGHSFMQIKKGGAYMTMLNGDAGSLDIVDLSCIHKNSDATVEANRFLRDETVPEKFLQHVSAAPMIAATTFWDDVVQPCSCSCGDGLLFAMPCMVVGHRNKITVMAFGAVSINNKTNEDAMLVTGSKDQIILNKVSTTVSKRTIADMKFPGTPTCVAFVNSPLTDSSRALAFAMGNHERVGVDNTFLHVDAEIVKMICMFATEPGDEEWTSAAQFRGAVRGVHLSLVL
jgi:hypothetical protein